MRESRVSDAPEIRFKRAASPRQLNNKLNGWEGEADPDRVRAPAALQRVAARVPALGAARRRVVGDRRVRRALRSVRQISRARGLYTHYLVKINIYCRTLHIHTHS